MAPKNHREEVEQTVASEAVAAMQLTTQANTRRHRRAVDAVSDRHLFGSAEESAVLACCGLLPQSTAQSLLERVSVMATLQANDGTEVKFDTAEVRRS